MTEVTTGHLLGGRVRHDQYRDGHRTGIEPVLLAASVPARPGERVIEGGTGSGAALLCLAARVPGIFAVGIERDPVMADLARRNLEANGARDVRVVTSDIADRLDCAPFDHAFANPPWHDQEGTPSPDARKEAAKRGATGLVAAWASALAKPLRPRGTLTFVLPIAAVPEALAALPAAKLGSPTLFPFWPRDGSTPKLVLMRGIKDGRRAFRLCAGLVLHEADGRFTKAAQSILADGTALSLDA